MSRRLVLLAWCAHAAPAWLPASLRGLEPVVRDSAVWEELLMFFKPGGGGSESYRVALDATCLNDLEPGTWDRRGAVSGFSATHDGNAPWWNPPSFALTHGKWSAETWLPLALARSRWGAKDAAETQKANATLVMFHSRQTERQGLSWCRQKLITHSKRWWKTPRGGEDHWFTAISSRGPCCDGGQARDPALLRHHFLMHAGEAPNGPWIFRESRFADALRRRTQYKAPVTRDTAPKIRCFDDRKDLALPPPMFLLRSASHAASGLRHMSQVEIDEESIGKCVRSAGRDATSCYLAPHSHASAAGKDVLVMHAEGKQGGLEYHLRRAMSNAWDVSPWDRGKSPPGARDDPRVDVRFAMPRRNYTQSMRRAKFCVVSEGYSQWSPRITEAVAHGCVPAFLSPSLQPPYSSLLDWSKFSVRFDEADIPRLPEVLEAYDHAALHANLLLVRHLFAFCVDGGGEDGCGGEALPGDGLPLVVFEMSRKKAAGGSDVPTPLDSETYAGTSRLLAAKDDGDATADADVDFNCTLATGACTYAFRGEEWHCSMVNEVHAECLQRVDGGWTVVGSTDNLRGHKQSLYFNDMYQPTKVAEKGRQKKALRARRRDDADT